MGTVTRVFEFDAAHRVMNEKMKCFNLHGHRFKVEVEIEYFTKNKLGYNIDFKEIKRTAGAWIDEKLDHACILNPMDRELIAFCQKNDWRLYVMGLGNDQWDVNPTAENIASELFYMLTQMFIRFNQGLYLKSIRLYETPNCWVEVTKSDYVATNSYINDFCEWRKSKGEVNYDSRVK